ncbi:hypothetical protein EVA_11172 [gut metagenome]|uniref:Uncharacterized protein n=1 Tax=gut metagenome TaxID=749906 RepID=J9G0G2_9ZZZZ
MGSYLECFLGHTLDISFYGAGVYGYRYSLILSTTQWRYFRCR